MLTPEVISTIEDALDNKAGDYADSRSADDPIFIDGMAKIRAAREAINSVEHIEALRAAQQCISDFLGVYRNGGSMLIMDLAVNSLKNDALRKIDKVLQRFYEEV